MQNKENLGFGAANNQGIKIAQGRFVFLLNSDTELKNNAFRCFLDSPVWNMPKVGAVGCCLQDETGRYNHSYGFFPSFKYVLYGMPKERLPANMDTSLSVDYVTGAALMIRRSVLDKIGAFDEEFFLYHEESELQYRMQKKGYRRLLINTPKIMHLRGKSLGGETERNYYRKIGLNLFFRKHKPIDYVLLNLHLFLCARTRTGKTMQNTVLIDEVFSQYVRTFWTLLASRGIKRVMLFGGGQHTRWLLQQIEPCDNGPVITGVIDEYDTKQAFIPIRTYLPQEITSYDYDAIVLSTDCHNSSFRNRCIELFGSDVQLIDLYADFVNKGPYPKKIL